MKKITFILSIAAMAYFVPVNANNSTNKNDKNINRKNDTASVSNFEIIPIRKAANTISINTLENDSLKAIELNKKIEKNNTSHGSGMYFEGMLED